MKNMVFTVLVFCLIQHSAHADLFKKMGFSSSKAPKCNAILSADTETASSDSEAESSSLTGTAVNLLSGFGLSSPASKPEPKPAPVQAETPVSGSATSNSQPSTEETEDTTTGTASSLLQGVAGLASAAASTVDESNTQENQAATALSGFLTGVSNTASQASEKAEEVEKIQADLKDHIDSTLKDLEKVHVDEVDDASYIKTLNIEIIKRLPGAAWRVFDFELGVRMFLEELIVPLIAIAREFEAGSYSASSQRKAKIEATLVVRSTETGFKALTLGLFGHGIPDFLGIVKEIIDFSLLENEIENSDKQADAFMKEMLSVIFLHMQKEVVNPDPNYSIQDRLQGIANLRPVLEQISVSLGERIAAESGGSFDQDKFGLWLENKANEFRFNEFGVAPDGFHFDFAQEMLVFPF